MECRKKAIPVCQDVNILFTEYNNYSKYMFYWAVDDQLFKDDCGIVIISLNPDDVKYKNIA